MNNYLILLYLYQFEEFKVWWAPIASKSKARALCSDKLKVMLMPEFTLLKFKISFFLLFQFAIDSKTPNTVLFWTEIEIRIVLGKKKKQKENILF